jgi:hypothetical protein
MFRTTNTVSVDHHTPYPCRYALLYAVIRDTGQTGFQNVRHHCWRDYGRVKIGSHCAWEAPTNLAVGRFRYLVERHGPEEGKGHQRRCRGDRNGG